MSKNRPHIPPPKFSLPTPVADGDLQFGPGDKDTRAEPLPAPLAIVRAPARVGTFTVHADRIEWANPTIDLPETVWLKHELPHRQTRRLEPRKAIVTHGLLIVEELGIALPVQGVEIRTAIKES